MWNVLSDMWYISHQKRKYKADIIIFRPRINNSEIFIAWLDLWQRKCSDDHNFTQGMVSTEGGTVEYPINRLMVRFRIVRSRSRNIGSLNDFSAGIFERWLLPSHLPNANRHEHVNNKSQRSEALWPFTIRRLIGSKCNPHIKKSKPIWSM